MTKTEKIRRALLKYPKLKAKDLAKKIGVSVQDVYSTRYLAKKQNKANGYAPLEMPINMRKEMLKEVVPGLNALFGVEYNKYSEKPSEVKDGDEELKAINLLFPKAKEEVNHPPHYTVGGVETIDFIEAKRLNFNLGNVVKYLSRAGEKDSDPLQDLQKARWYLNREIARVE
jgi:hypothetical protein